jgi:hypothetical protein
MSAVVIALASRPLKRGRAPEDPDWQTFESEFWAYVADPSHDDLLRLSQLLHEALELCDQADELLPEIRDDDGPPGELSHRAAPVVARLERLRDGLAAIRTPRLRGLARDGEALISFYGQHLYHALSLLATSWRDERLREQRERLRPVTWARRRLADLVDTVDDMLGAAT